MTGNQLFDLRKRWIDKGLAQIATSRKSLEDGGSLSEGYKALAAAQTYRACADDLLAEILLAVAGEVSA